METNEILTNEEVIKTNAEIIENVETKIAKVSTGKGFKVAVGIGLGVLAGVMIWRYAAKPIIAKMKAEKKPEVISDDEKDDEISANVMDYVDDGYSKDELEEETD